LGEMGLSISKNLDKGKIPANEMAAGATYLILNVPDRKAAVNQGLGIRKNKEPRMKKDVRGKRRGRRRSQDSHHFTEREGDTKSVTKPGGNFSKGKTQTGFGEPGRALGK